MLAAGWAAAEETVDYSDPENWAYFGIGEDRDADVFLICPTVESARRILRPMPAAISHGRFFLRGQFCFFAVNLNSGSPLSSVPY